MEHPGENLPGFRDEEQRFPVVDLGADFVPDTLLEYSWFSHINIYGIESAFCFNRAAKNYKKQGEISLQAASGTGSLPLTALGTPHFYLL
jgi:hypothetical protein